MNWESFAFPLASFSLLFVPKHWTRMRNTNKPAIRWQGIEKLLICTVLRKENSRTSSFGNDQSNQDGGSTRHLGNYPQDPGNEVAIKPEHRLSTWVGKRERFPTNFAIMSQSESYFASLGVVKWLPCELLREKWRQTTKRGVTTTRHERELIFLSFFIFYFK